MYCSQCGTENAADAHFCLNCGANLNTTKQSQTASPRYQEPYPMEETSSSNQRSSIIDHLPDANTSDFADSMSASYYLLAILFWPIGFFLWSYHRQRKPQSAKNLFTATLFGFVFMFSLFLL